MKAALAPVVPVQPDVILTLSYQEAQDLRHMMSYVGHMTRAKPPARDTVDALISALTGVVGDYEAFPHSRVAGLEMRITA